MLLPRKTAFTILVFVVLLSLLSARNVLRTFDITSVIAGVLEFPLRNPAALPEPVEPVRPPKPVLAHLIQPQSPVVVQKKPAFAHLNDPSHALANFYEALRRTETGDGVTRILHYGDSPVTADSITSDVRDLLQERFGDAGHGFVLIAKPWAWYGHRGVDMESDGWLAEPASQGTRAQDGIHGLGGVAFEGWPGAHSVLRVETGADRVEISFLRRPNGGTFRVESAGQSLGTVDTANPGVQPGWAAFPLPAGEGEVRIEVESGMVRLLGASFQKRAKGVIYNSLGLNGGQVQVIVRFFNHDQWAAQLQHERPDLVIINYGTNESLYPDYLDSAYPDELRTVIQRIKEAVPDASILIMSPMDRGERDATGQIATLPAVPRIVRIQHDIASQTGCAFFNTFQAMGGEGTMARWYASQPQLVTADFTHPFPAGARKVGMLLDDALMTGYEQFKAHRGVLTSQNRIGAETGRE